MPERTKEEGGVAVLPNVGSAMHRELRRIFHREPVVHHGKDALLVLSSIPRPEYGRALLLHVEDDRNLGIQTMFLPVFIDL